MKYLILKGSYDPVSEAEIEAAEKRRKEGQYDLAILMVQKEGILPLEDREELLAHATAPYRRIACMNEQEAESLLSLKETDVKDMESFEEERIRTGEFHLAACGTRRLLVEKGFYLNEIVDARCNSHRAAHSKSVAAVCKDLAHAHHLDEWKAWRMGMLHDITKKWTDEESERLLRIYDPDKLSQNPKIWHSYTAPVWLRTVMGIHDETILHAIYHHTLGTGSGDYDRILYIADKTEPLRGYDSSRELALSRRSLKEGSELVLSESKKYLLEKEGIHA